MHPTAEAVEDDWRRVLGEGAAGGAVELGRERATLGELVEAACHAAHPAATRLGPLGERLLVDAVAAEAGGPYAAIARTRGLRRGLHRLLAELRRAGVTAEALRAAARRAGGVAGAHGQELARRLAAFDRLRRDRFDEAEAWRSGLSAIAGGARVAMLEGVERVEVKGVFDWEPARLALLDALLERRLPVRVILPEPRADLTRALAPILSSFEARHAQALEVALEPLPEAAPSFTRATSPHGEARALARQVRDLLDGGVAPERIGVCAETSGRRARLREALERYGVPVADRRPLTAASAPPVRIALEVCAAVEERLPRERLVALLSSRYVAGGVDSAEGWLPPHRVARALREAGAGDAAAYAERTEAWARAQPEARRAAALAIARHVGERVRTLSSLPAHGTLAEHSVALHGVLDGLELFARARGFRAGGHGDSEEARAVARDQAAVRELEAALVDLPRAAARAGLASSVFDRAGFARLIGEVLGARPLRAGGVRGAAVELTDLEGVAGRRFAHLFVCGLHDGEVPARAVEDPLLPDDERLALNRAFGSAVLPLAGRLEPLGRLRFAAALAAAERAHLSWTRSDESGAPLLRSPLVDELRPSAIVEVGLEPIPRVADACTEGELIARVTLESRGDRASRLSAPDPGVEVELTRRLTARAPARMARIAERVAVEQERERFFDGGAGAESRFAGGLRDLALLPLLRERLPGSAAAPLSAKVIEQYAACPFQFFLRSLVRAAPFEEADDDLDPMKRGRLLHRILQHVFARLAERGRLPLTGAAAEAEAVDAGCDEVFAEAARSGAVGHPGLFVVHGRRIRRQVQALVRAEIADPPAPGCLPARFEQPFGPLAVEAPEGGDRLYLRGSIDRVDLGDGRAVVLDYKTGGIAGFREQVKEDALCVSSWQLPIYAAAVRAELGAGVTVEGHFYSLRDGAITKPIGSRSLLALEAGERAELREPGRRNLGDALWQLYRAMQGGDFAVRPHQDACDRCHMEAACRVVRRRVDGDDP